MRYAELHCLSNFSFLRGASQPEELVERAAACGYTALAITDECSVAGVVRAHVAAKEHGCKLIIGAEFQLDDGLRCVLLVQNRRGYGQLCRLITRGRRAAPKGEYRLTRNDFTGRIPRGPTTAFACGCPARRPAAEKPAGSQKCFPQRLWLAVELLTTGTRSPASRRSCRRLAREVNLPLVATGDVHMHARGRRALQDVLTATRLGTTVDQAGLALFPNGERHLRPHCAHRASCIHPNCSRRPWTSPHAARSRWTNCATNTRARSCPRDQTPASWLRHLTEAGKQHRWPGGVPEQVAHAIEHELALIEELAYEPYFLTVHDIVQFARSRGILCQGRGSAANSAVCFCLGITEVDPARMSLLFERFISKERNEPPDIDVDFEHERREEVIQYIYAKYGRQRAALAGHGHQLPSAQCTARCREGHGSRCLAGRRTRALDAVVGWIAHRCGACARGGTRS